MTSSKRVRTTIHDVAHAAGVSISTVSKALNDTGRMQPETRERIPQDCRRAPVQAECPGPKPSRQAQLFDRPAHQRHLWPLFPADDVGRLGGARRSWRFRLSLRHQRRPGADPPAYRRPARQAGGRDHLFRHAIGPASADRPVAPVGPRRLCLRRGTEGERRAAPGRRPGRATCRGTPDRPGTQAYRPCHRTERFPSRALPRRGLSAHLRRCRAGSLRLLDRGMGS